MGLLQVISRIGAASAPWVAQFLRHVDERLPFILMGGLTILAGFLCFKLNETNGKETAEVFSNMRVVEGTKHFTKHSRFMMLRVLSIISQWYTGGRHFNTFCGDVGDFPCKNFVCDPF